MKTFTKLLYLSNREKSITSKDRGLRDRQMGENLIWLTTECFPARKIIAWTATIHNARNLSQIEQDLYKDSAVMGDYVWSVLNTKMYSLGFTAYEGLCGGRGHQKNEYNALREIPPASLNSLEDLMMQAGLENGFLDFRHVSNDSCWL